MSVTIDLKTLLDDCLERSKDATEFALIVNPGDVETPLESLRVRILVKIKGYLADVAARRIPDRHVRLGDAYLVALP